MKFICDVKSHEPVQHKKSPYDSGGWECHHCGEVPRVYYLVRSRKIEFSWKRYSEIK